MNKSTVLVATVLAMLLALSQTAIAARTDRDKFQSVVKKVVKLHCVCNQTDLQGLGDLVPTVGGAIAGRTYVKLFCFVPEFDSAGAGAGGGTCSDFQVLSR